MIITRILKIKLIRTLSKDRDQSLISFFTTQKFPLLNFCVVNSAGLSGVVKFQRAGYRDKTVKKNLKILNQGEVVFLFLIQQYIFNFFQSGFQL